MATHTHMRCEHGKKHWELIHDDKTRKELQNGKKMKGTDFPTEQKRGELQQRGDI